LFHVKHKDPVSTKKQEVYLSVKDYLVSGERFSLLKNEAFEMLETNPQPSPESISKYYESDRYISHTDSHKGFLNTIYQAVKRYSLRRKIDLIEKYNVNKGVLLDIGAGTGDFLHYAAKKGWDIEGVEINGQARELAEQKGIKLFDSMSAIEGNQFDVVTLWHVLEHLHDLPTCINQITKFVKPG
jgi:2-polyprenyl-3-methyl-5-hydroxy-6-metoxy-1,4-benzoquinol methylase